MVDAKKKHPAPQPHDKTITKISEDVHVVHGSFKMAPGVRIALTMTIVRRDGDLTILNSMMVNKDMEEQIKKLGTVKHVVRICSNHGAADEYYVDTFGAKYWDLPGAAETEGASKVPATTNILEDGGELPGVPDSKVICLKNIKMPDAIVRLPDAGGILVSGDFIQNGRKDSHDSFLMCAVLKRTVSKGFATNALTTPPPFFGFYGKGEDLSANCPTILALEFDKIIPAHGPTVLEGAKEDLKKGWEKVEKTENWKGL